MAKKILYVFRKKKISVQFLVTDISEYDKLYVMN